MKGEENFFMCEIENTGHRLLQGRCPKTDERVLGATFMVQSERKSESSQTKVGGTQARPIARVGAYWLPNLVSVKRLRKILTRRRNDFLMQHVLRLRSPSPR